MEPSIANLADNFDSLWEIADEALEQLKETELTETNKNTKNTKKNDKSIDCNHIFCEGVCQECGLCKEGSNISHEGEWNIYKDDTGKYSKNTQRADTFKDSNPYSVGGTLLPGSKKTLIAKLQIQQTFSHKQKTFWQVGSEIENAATKLNINSKEIIDTAKGY